MGTKAQLIECLNKVEIKLEHIETIIIEQNNLIQELKLSHEKLYKELYKKKRQLEYYQSRFAKMDSIK